MARMKYLVLHCTATPEGREVTSNEIRHWHTDPVSKGGRGWKQVGYTDLIHLDGKVERLVDNNEDAEVDPWEVTNGAKGYNSCLLYTSEIVVCLLVLITFCIDQFEGLRHDESYTLANTAR